MILCLQKARKINSALWRSLIEFRKQLHSIPEISTNEYQTSATVLNFIKQFNPDKFITDIGGTGVTFIYSGEAKGETIMPNHLKPKEILSWIS